MDFIPLLILYTDCFGGTWHDVAEDHTPSDINGYMMVVNASFNPGDFFVKTVDGLCPNTTYEFAAWIFNVLEPFACRGQGIKPNITFNIETTDRNSSTILSNGRYSSKSGLETIWVLFFNHHRGKFGCIKNDQ